MGPAAKAASGALSAGGYVLSGRAAFAERPSLHTAAHEAVHMLHHAYGGPTLSHGVGHLSDAHERMADRVADVVTAGGSAEPLLASAFGGQSPSAASGPMLQMINHISSSRYKNKATPWAEIDNQLQLTSDIDSKVAAVNPNRFGPMVTQLGDVCARAEEVTATLDGGRKGGPRTGDPMQTAFGALGSFEEYITDTAEVPKYQFEGGHLIADEILGDDSYVEQNFAPQRRRLNSPIYRKIEEIAAGGLAFVGKKYKKTPTWTLTANVGYPAQTHKVPTDQVQKRLNIANNEIGKKTKPKTITLTTRVPSRWTAVAEVNDKDFVFQHESSLDKKDGAYAGFKGSEALALAEEVNTGKYLDATYWGMDTLKNSSVKRPGTVGTGQASRHSFSAVQSVPRGQSLFQNAKSTALPKTKALVAPRLVRRRPLSEILFAKTADRDRLILTILRENPSLDLTQISLRTAFNQLIQGKLKRQRGTKFSKLDYLKMSRRGVGKTRRGKKKSATAKVAVKKSASPQQQDSLAKLIVLQEFTDANGDMDFSL
ncbi:MAG: hypothetical protein Q7T61_16870 [Caulobacter sp.]|nr:hypothetical protein [Caulobacter sp.]